MLRLIDSSSFLGAHGLVEDLDGRPCSREIARTFARTPFDGPQTLRILGASLPARRDEPPTRRERQRRILRSSSATDGRSGMVCDEYRALQPWTAAERAGDAGRAKADNRTHRRCCRLVAFLATPTAVADACGTPVTRCSRAGHCRARTFCVGRREIAAIKGCALPAGDRGLSESGKIVKVTVETARLVCEV